VSFNAVVFVKLIACARRIPHRTRWVAVARESMFKLPYGSTPYSTAIIAWDGRPLIPGASRLRVRIVHLKPARVLQSLLRTLSHLASSKEAAARLQRQMGDLRYHHRLQFHLACSCTIFVRWVFFWPDQARLPNGGPSKKLALETRERNGSVSSFFARRLIRI
jgi:hypothetical protein